MEISGSSPDRITPTFRSWTPPPHEFWAILSFNFVYHVPPPTGHGIPDIVLVLLETELRSDFQWNARVTESPHELAVISQRVGFDNSQDTVQRPL